MMETSLNIPYQPSIYMSSDEEETVLSSPPALPHEYYDTVPYPPLSPISYYYEEMPPSPSHPSTSDDNDPPYSRVFIVCGKTVTEDQLLECFGTCGKIEYCKIVRDKPTGESKGVAYIKYTKASSAALAIETFHGKQVADNSQPLKVMIADVKGANKMNRPVYSDPEDMPPRSRLFVVCSKDMTEEELSRMFKAHGDVDFCKLVKDKQTGESKGYGYVKYAKASVAALAMEAVNEQHNSNVSSSGVKIKALIADPKNKIKRQTEHKPEVMVPMYGAIGYMPPYMAQQLDYTGIMTPYMHPMYSTYMVTRQRLFIVCHKAVTQDSLQRLFAQFPGLDYVDLKKNQNGESKGFAYANYLAPHSAAAAKERLDGIEFPPGHTLKVMFAEPKGETRGKPDLAPVTNPGTAYAHPMISGYPPYYYISPPPSPDHSDRNYPEGSRLFIVLVGKLVPENLLHDVFVQFPGLEYVKMQKDKNFGFVKYSSPQAAQYAINYLNGADIQGTKLKVQVANPSNSPQSSTDSRKRQKT